MEFSLATRGGPESRFFLLTAANQDVTFSHTEYTPVGHMTNLAARMQTAASMSDNRAARLSRLVDELTEAAKRLGLEVRRERILREVGYRARGGACRLREKYLI
jgi:hypothetical protein